MAQVHVLRHKVQVEGLSIRRVAREMCVSRNTVGDYLRQPQPVRYEAPRRKPVLEQVAPRIDELLAEWSHRTTPKQRITGTRIHRKLRGVSHAGAVPSWCADSVAGGRPTLMSSADA
jgi:hypothetical protein